MRSSGKVCEEVTATKTLILDTWVQGGDNVDFEIEVPDEVADAVELKYLEYCKANEYPASDETIWNLFGMHYRYKLDEIYEGLNSIVEDAVVEDIRESLIENGYDEDLEEDEDVLDTVDWGYSIKGLR